MIPVKSKTLLGLFKESAKQKSRKVVITFYPAYDSRIHSNLSKKLIAELKKEKVSTFDVIDEGLEIIALTKSKDVKSINWKQPYFFDGW